MGLLDALFGGKKKSPDGVRTAPCILCGKSLPVGRTAPANKVFYPLTGKHYALCARGCDGKGRPDDHKLWSRIAALSESQRATSEVSGIS